MGLLTSDTSRAALMFFNLIITTEIESLSSKERVKSEVVSSENRFSASKWPDIPGRVDNTGLISHIFQAILNSRWRTSRSVPNFLSEGLLARAVVAGLLAPKTCSSSVQYILALLLKSAVPQQCFLPAS